jgi:hypothetical protein
MRAAMMNRIYVAIAASVALIGAGFIAAPLVKNEARGNISFDCNLTPGGAAVLKAKGLNEDLFDRFKEAPTGFVSVAKDSNGKDFKVTVYRLHDGFAAKIFGKQRACYPK